jgi:hypothetical protein
MEFCRVTGWRLRWGGGHTSCTYRCRGITKGKAGGEVMGQVTTQVTLAFVDKHGRVRHTERQDIIELDDASLRK